MSETQRDIRGLLARLKNNDPSKLNLRCETCGEPMFMECTVDGNNGSETYIVHRQCACRRKEYAEYAERQRRNDIEIEREKALPNVSARRCRFETSQDSANLRMIKTYADKWEKVVTQGEKGLMLWGSVGTGKTHAAYCLANALIDKGVKVYLTSIAALADATFYEQEDRNYIRNRVKGCGLLILDDFGAERETSFMAEKAFMFIDERVNTGRPFVVTTNVSPREMKAATDITKTRIYDRILGKTVALEFTGASKRRGSVDANAASLFRTLTSDEV